MSDRDHKILAFERQWWKYAGAKEQAVKEVRFHAPLQGCGNYAITKIEEVK